tara:strand:- start:11510 stop:11896 length:387 start_codon:yes stop_codon:yes gene_type:complete
MEKDFSYIGLTFVTVIAIILILGFIFMPKPDSSFTELYFTEYSDSGLEFTINNLEGHSEQYNYTIYIVYYDNGQYYSQETVKTEYISLNNDQSATFSQSLDINNAYDTALIMVDIGSQNIYYTVEIEQ